MSNTNTFEINKALIKLRESENIDNSILAIEKAEEALSIFRSLGDKIGESQCLINIAAYVLHCNEYERALFFLYQALSNQELTCDIISQSMSLINISSCYHFLGNHKSQLLSAQEGIRRIEKSVNANEAIGRYVFLKNVGWELRSDRNSQIYANALINYGNALRSLGEHDKAIEAYSKAQKLMAESKDVQGQAIVHNQIGEVFRERGDYVQALEHYQKAKVLFEQINKRGYEYATVLQSLGEVHSAEQRFEEALLFYNNAMTEFAKAGDKTGESQVRLLQGEARIAMKQYKKATAILKKALNMAKSVSAADVIVKAHRALGMAMLHTDSAQSKEYFLKALLLAKDHSMKLELVNIHREMANFYKTTGESSEALLHFERYHTLEREIFNEKAEKQLRNLQVLNEVEQYKASLQESQHKISELEIELRHKTEELAELANRIFEKAQFVQYIQRGLERIVELSQGESRKAAIELLDSIDKQSHLSTDKKKFSQKFSELHTDFIRLLSLKFPQLTQMELKICTLLKMQLSNKEAAEILNLSVRNIENHRYRIRKKLKLKTKDNVGVFLAKV